mgnify:CR=1 FL=1
MILDYRLYDEQTAKSLVNLVHISDKVEAEIAYMGRVSNTAATIDMPYSKLMAYLVGHKHWSPFEMHSMAVSITTTRDIGRQILRHRSFSFQEFSQRYSQQTEFFLRELRAQNEHNRQASIDIFDQQAKSDWYAVQTLIIRGANEAYTALLKGGAARECARCILPEGNTSTRMYMSGTIRSWIHYIRVRQVREETQLEHAWIAEACRKLLIEHMPSLDGVI